MGKVASCLRWPFCHSSFDAQKYYNQCQLISDGHGTPYMMVSGITPRPALPHSPLCENAAKNNEIPLFFEDQV